MEDSIEVFIAYTDNFPVLSLKHSLEGWSIEGAEPIAIKVPEKKYEVIRRVTSENMATGDYILAICGSVPNSEQAIEDIESTFRANEKVGMLRFGPDGLVVACRKGIIERWPQNKSGDYKAEHELAYSIEGYETTGCPLTYRMADVH